MNKLKKTMESKKSPEVTPKELPVKSLGDAALKCAGCVFAQLGCPKQNSGQECPPPQYFEAGEAWSLLEDDRVAKVVPKAGGGYLGVVKESPVKNRPKTAQKQKQAAKPKPKPHKLEQHHPGALEQLASGLATAAAKLLADMGLVPKESTK